MGACAVQRDVAVHRGLRLRRLAGHDQLRGRALRAEGRCLEDARRLHASGLHAAAPADAARARRGRRACAVRRLALCEERRAAHHGEGGARPGRLCAPREGEVGLREGPARRLVGRRVAVALLPVAGREAGRDAHAGRRPGGPQGGEAHSGRRDGVPGGASFARAHAIGVDRPFGDRRARPGHAQPRARHLQPALPEPAALFGGFHRGVPRGAARSAGGAARHGSRKSSLP